MEPNTQQSSSVVLGKPKTSAKDFFLHLGAIVALYVVIFNLINLLFTVINKAYPQIDAGYYGFTSYSISFPVATLIVFFPVFILLMWILQKTYNAHPEKKQLGVRKWLTYITLFVAGLALAGDLVTILYYFIDGQELTTGFLLKVVVVFIITGCVFYYYLSDIREKLTVQKQKIWAIIVGIIILASIAWGFSVLGSPRTQQLMKYDEQKVSHLMEINSQIAVYWNQKKALPISLDDLTKDITYYSVPNDVQTGLPYVYEKINAQSYKLCATFNRASEAEVNGRTYPAGVWVHPEGYYCFSQTVTENNYPKTVPVY